MWLYAGIIFILVKLAASNNVTDLQQTLILCPPGDITENEYNKCICTPSHVYECFAKRNEDHNSTDIPVSKEKPTCDPEMVYAFDSTTCICSKEGFWPHPKCEDIFKSFHNTTERCKPNSYVKIGCNICKCGSDGLLDRGHCTRNKCNGTDASKARRFIRENQVYGSCETRNWYSLAPCQFCYCVSENRLVCNTGHNYSKKLQLGSYNLSICGLGLLKDAMSLVPELHKLNLRQSLKEERAQTTSTTATESEINETKNVSFEMHSEKVIDEKPATIESIEYYTETEEDQKETPLNVDFNDGIELSTKINYEEGDDNLDKTKQSEEININGQTTKPSLTKVDVQAKSISSNDPAKVQKDSANIISLGHALKPYLPVMLDKVFQMALRKSLVSIDDKAKCTPGSTTVLNCNSCFCMKNNKLLCTNYKCERDIGLTLK